MKSPKSGLLNFRLFKGDTAQGIATLGAELSIELIVMGTIGRIGISGLLIGNTAKEVLQTAHTSVLAVTPKKFVSPTTVP